ncbi:hypothetical protein B0H10DRAFT_1959582 [Mycena sp. CBHHK59/15]|nr:hypothetical protein B0H10DRAFT_1959582 [Mycena sp. CBHHK59/15]
MLKHLSRRNHAGSPTQTNKYDPSDPNGSLALYRSLGLAKVGPCDVGESCTAVYRTHPVIVVERRGWAAGGPRWWDGRKDHDEEANRTVHSLGWGDEVKARGETQLDARMRAGPDGVSTGTAHESTAERPKIRLAIAYRLEARIWVEARGHCVSRAVRGHYLRTVPGTACLGIVSGEEQQRWGNRDTYSVVDAPRNRGEVESTQSESRIEWKVRGGGGMAWTQRLARVQGWDAEDEQPVTNADSAPQVSNILVGEFAMDLLHNTYGPLWNPHSDADADSQAAADW